MFAGRLGLVFVVAALCLAGRTANAQSAPLTYWTPGWLGFGGNLNAGQGANTDGDFASFDGGGAGGFSSTRYNFASGWFVGNERGAMGFGLGLSGINQAGAFGSLQTEGVQYGYNFKNAPVSVYAGFDTLKYNSGIGGAFSPFDLTSSTAPGYGVHAGVEFKPTSNLSLSLGFGYTQQSGRLDTDTKSPSLSNASQVDLVGGWR
jgi:opacity protein-like surface antigen